MPRILLSASFPVDLLMRQTPGDSGQWDEFQFVDKTSPEPVDGWVVYDDLPASMEQTCSPTNTLLMTGEPESLRTYRSRFTGQFGQVWTSHRSIKHPHLTWCNEAQPWHYAMRAGAIYQKQLRFDELRDLPRPQKTKLVSVICSSKANTEDQRRRLEFVKFLQSRFGDSIDVFGRGIRTMDDKSEAIHDYKYHIVLENDHSDCFMTEKLPDAFLGWSYPIYFGGSEANHRYPDGSFTAIDIYEPEQALAMIRSVLDTNSYESNLANIARARQAVLFENNIFALLSEYWRSNLSDEASQLVRLFPKNHRTQLMLRQVGRAVSRPFAKSAA